MEVGTHAQAGCKTYPGALLAIFLILLPSISLADDGQSGTGPQQQEEPQIQWKSLLGDSLTFLAVSHSFRWAKEAYTREATLTGSYLHGVGAAVGSLHGWSDGDEFLTNYVGHPMMGAIAGYIFSHNDPMYRVQEFGQNRAYWRGKTRAFVFSAIYSLQFEIGPFSEATVGKIQASWPQNGLVDWAVTPTIGLAWTLAEDSLDEYIAKPLEGKIGNPALRAMIRGGLNPARTFANLMALKYPWHRDTRQGVRDYHPDTNGNAAGSNKIVNLTMDPTDRYGREHASFAFNVPFQATKFGRIQCLGGGATAQLPLNSSWDVVVDLSGCKLIGLPENSSGDSLTYMIGARWSPKTAERIAPHVRFMVGGHKVYEEIVDPERRAILLAEGEKGTYYHDVYLDYTRTGHTNGLAVSIGGGVDLGFNRAVGLRLASLEYLYSWTSPLNGHHYNNGLRFSTGLTVNVGGW